MCALVVRCGAGWCGYDREFCGYQWVWFAVIPSNFAADSHTMALSDTFIRKLKPADKETKYATAAG